MAFGQRPEATQALTNAKTLALAVLRFEVAHHDHMPQADLARQLKPLLKPYLKNDSAWNTTNPAHSEFAFNRCLGGVDANIIENPGATPLIYDDKPMPNGYRTVAFVDGHVQMVSKEGWNNVEPNLRLKFPRKRKG